MSEHNGQLEPLVDNVFFVLREELVKLTTKKSWRTCASACTLFGTITTMGFCHSIDWWKPEC